MKLQTKAIYNLLRLNPQEASQADVKPWALEDLRQVALESLFQRLANLGVSLQKPTFVSFAEECDTPEELVELLVEEGISPEHYDQMYLLIFELWRRILPEKQSLSIFCDELDHRIFQYDQELLDSDESIQDILANLQDILEENVDEGEDPIRVFSLIGEYCAHDIEGFLYDYIAELLDHADDGYAGELLDGFSPFVSESFWFEFLRARALSFTDPFKANAEIARILDKHPQNETSFLFDILRFLSISGEHRLFIAVIQKIIAQLDSEEQFEELMAIAADYYRRLDQEDVEKAIERLMKKRSSSTYQFNPKDPDLKTFAQSLK
ncbi:MAG: hypothetical protein Q8L98_05500 [Chlamydiales bacterium]|nr:hypothetical protein [Chlamydiales bacterium]